MTADSSRSFEDELDNDAFVDALADFDELLRRGASLIGAEPAASTIDQGIGGAHACIRLLERAFPRACRTVLSAPTENLGRFELLRILGQGGFGVVYLARDPRLGRLVALKIPRLHTLGNATLHERFLREARAAAALDHPNIMPILETGEIGPVCYIASAYCDGADLAQWVKTQAPVSPVLSAKILATLSDAAHYSHTRGILHRDIKPSNILLAARNAAIGVQDEELPFVLRLTDFGLARLAEENWGETGSMVLGTPTYMSPEQAAGRNNEVCAATDVYALGVILYELLTARPPFQGANLVEVLDQIRSADPVSPSRLVRSIPREIETICLKCLRKEVGGRYASAAELRNDLQRFLRHEPIQAQPISLWTHGVKWGCRHPAGLSAVLVSVISVLLLIGGLSAHLYQMGKQLRVTEELQRAGQERESTLRMQAYVGEVEAAATDLEAGTPQTAYRRLERLIPSTGDHADMRGPEWHYLQGQSRPTIPVVTFCGQEGSVSAVAVTPDEQFAATGDGKGFIKLSDMKTGKERISFKAHSSQIVHLRFSTNGMFLASVVSSTSADGVRIWNAFDGNLVSEIGRNQAIASVDFSPDGEHLISGGADGEVRCWDWRNANERWHRRLDGVVRCVRYSHGGDAAYSTLDDGHLTRWETETGKLLHMWQMGDSRDKSIEIDLPPDSRFVLGGGTSAQIFCFDTQEIQQWVLPVDEIINTVDCSSDGTRAAVGTANGQIYLLTFGTESFRSVKIQRWIAHDAVSDLTFLPKANKLVSVGGVSDRTAKVWDLNDIPSEQATFLSATQVNYVGFNHVLAANSQRAVTATRSGWFRLWNVRQLKDGPTFEVPRLPFANIIADPSGDRIAAVVYDRALTVWDHPQVENTPQTVSIPGIRTIALAPNHQTLAVGISLDGGKISAINLYDLSTRALLRQLCSTSGQISQLKYSHDGQVLVATFTNGPLQLVDAVMGTVTPVPGSGLEPPIVVAHDAWLSVNAAAAIAAVGYSWPTIPPHVRLNDGNEIHLINTRSAQVTSTIRHGSTGSQLSGLALSSDGRILAIASCDASRTVGQVALWHVATGRVIMKLPCFKFIPHHIHFLPGAKYLAANVMSPSSRTNDGTLLWPLVGLGE